MAIGNGHQDKGAAMQLASVVSPEVLKVRPESPLIEAAKAMNDQDLGSVAIAVNDRLLGIFTERDLLRAVADGADLATSEVSDWMTAPADTVDVSMQIREAAEWMLASGYRHLPVVENGAVVGMVSIKDVMWGLTAADY